MQKYLDEQIAKSRKELEDLEKDEQDRIDAARRRVQELEEEKLRLEKELLELRQKGTTGDLVFPQSFDINRFGVPFLFASPWR